MRVYQDLLRRILTTGVRQENRTGVPTLFVPGAALSFDLREGFPMLTTKRVPWKPIVGELLGFCRGYTNAKDFRDLGAGIWDKNANEDGVNMAGEVVPNPWLTNPNRKGADDLGRIYGAQWRTWQSSSSDACRDQLWEAVQTIKNNPTSRRILVNAWRPDEFDQMALPPCHVMHQYLVDTTNKVLHMTMYQRSADVPLGVPFNIASYALLLTIIAKMTGYTPGTFTHFMADAHIYENQVDLAWTQNGRTPGPLPDLVYDGPDLPSLLEQHGSQVFHYIEPKWFNLEGYAPHGPLAYPFNV